MGDAEQEVFVDTFDRGSHTSWVGTRRRTSTTPPSHDTDVGRKLYDQYRTREVDGWTSDIGDEGYGYF
jgi:hypothetical protein